MTVIQEPGASYKLIKSLSNKDLFVYSSASLAGHQIDLPESCFVLNTRKIGKIKENIDAEIETNNNYADAESVVCFGGGVATDVAKYISLKIGRSLTSIPSAVSTNSFATNKVCLISEGVTKTMDGHLPDKVIIDMELLSRSDPEMNLCGIAELLSFHTALFDWRIADNDNIEKIDPFFYDLGKLSLDKTLHLVESTKFDIRDISSIKFIIEELMLSGFMVNLYGSGRPQSGSEHIFSRRLEDAIRIPHGMSISLGIVIMSLLQNNGYNEVKSILKRVGLIDAACKRGASKKVIEDIMSSLEPRGDRYSILNKLNKGEIRSIMKEVDYI